MLIFISFVVSGAFAQINEVAKQTDQLDENGEFIAEKDLLLKWVDKTGKAVERAELYWRLSRVCLNLGEDAKTRGSQKEAVLLYFAQGEQYADLAIQNDTENPEGYFWKGANIGSWGNTKGMLEALGNAEPMRNLLRQALVRNPEHADSFYVLCTLYNALPGWPLSFGNNDYAVSLGRKAVIFLEKELAAGKQSVPQYGYYIELAKALWNRNWDINKRFNEKTNKLKEYTNKYDPLEKNFFYESQLNLKSLSDREEAREIILWVISQIEKISGKNYFQKKDMEAALKLKFEWK